MRIVCSWCGKELGEKEPLDDQSETHGKCNACLKKQPQAVRVDDPHIAGDSNN